MRSSAQVQGHQQVVHVGAFEQERLAVGALDLEAVAFVEAAGAGVGGEDAEDEAADAFAPRPLDRGAEQAGADPLALTVRGDREALHFGHVGGRLERHPGAEDQVADDLLRSGGDQHVVGAEAIEERTPGVGRRGGADPRRPGRGVEPALRRLVTLLRRPDQENFCGSSLQ